MINHLCKPKDYGLASELWTLSALARYVAAHAVEAGFPGLAKAVKATVWRILNEHDINLDAGFCIDCLEEALRNHGKPEIFNSDQGSQFTSDAFTGVLQTGRCIVISLDGRERAFDNIFVERLWRNVKHEDVYLKVYASMGELTTGLAEYFAFYNEERPHQSLCNITPDVVYRTEIGGGAMIVDKYPRAVEEAPAPLRSTVASSTAESGVESVVKATVGQCLPAVIEVKWAA